MCWEILQFVRVVLMLTQDYKSICLMTITNFSILVVKINLKINRTLKQNVVSYLYINIVSKQFKF